jgi:PAB-dependent poly(A)-specific ribonuclease subunit 2
MGIKYRSIEPITHQRDLFQPVTALSFDPVSDVLWAGSNSGRVVAYHGESNSSGVSFPVGGNRAVRKIAVGENYVRACVLEGEGVGSWNKNGMNKWNLR